MVGDEYPPITTHSDVYAFGVVAMEVRFAYRFITSRWIVLTTVYPLCPQVLTGLLPFPLRKNDHGVTVDILAGWKPSHCASMVCIGVPDALATGLCEMMDSCWHKDPTSRPSMGSIYQSLGRVTPAKYSGLCALQLGNTSECIQSQDPRTEIQPSYLDLTVFPVRRRWIVQRPHYLLPPVGNRTTGRRVYLRREGLSVSESAAPPSKKTTRSRVYVVLS